MCVSSVTHMYSPCLHLEWIYTLSVFFNYIMTVRIWFIGDNLDYLSIYLLHPEIYSVISFYDQDGLLKHLYHHVHKDQRSKVKVRGQKTTWTMKLGP